MNTINKTVYIFAGIALVLGLLIGFAVSPKVQTMGAVSAYQAMNSQSLLNVLTSLNAPLTGILTTSSTIVGGSMATSSTGTFSTSTSITLAGSQPGDYIVIGVSTSTANVIYTGTSASGTITVTATNTSSTPVTLLGTTYTVLDLPLSTFKAPGL